MVAVLGIIISFVALVLPDQRSCFMFTLMWLLYLSLYSVGQTFLNFQWWVLCSSNAQKFGETSPFEITYLCWVKSLYVYVFRLFCLILSGKWNSNLRVHVIRIFPFMDKLSGFRRIIEFVRLGTTIHSSCVLYRVILMFYSNYFIQLYYYQPCQHRLSQATTPSTNSGHHWHCMAKEHPFGGN